MIHDHCPVCHHDSLRADFRAPPDHLTDDEYDAWMEDNSDPIGVRCDHCGYEAE